MLDLNRKLQGARLEQERTMLSRQIEAMDGAIDKMVYELYGLTEEEVAIVQQTGHRPFIKTPDKYLLSIGEGSYTKNMPIQKHYETVIRLFARFALERYPLNIAKIILYGSVARGETRADSDIDLLVLWNGDENEGWHAMTGLAFDVMVDTGEYLSVKVMNAQAFNPASPFVQNVTKEGITVA